jgi:Protein of unknown function, DUF255
LFIVIADRSRATRPISWSNSNTQTNLHLIMTTTTLNSLARASSAYLRSAMHQPILWHEWGEEAHRANIKQHRLVLPPRSGKGGATGAT